MANTVSDLLAGIDTVPQTKNNAFVQRGRVRFKSAHVAVAGTESASHKFPMVRMSASDRPVYVSVLCDDLHATTGAMDIGTYVAGDWDAADQTAVDADCLADAWNSGTASVVEVTGIAVFGTGTNAPNADDWGKPLYTLSGASEPDPGTQYDIAVDCPTAPDQAGDMSMHILYVQGD